MTTIFLDLETRSRCDIKQSGGHVYVRDDSTELLCGVAMVVEGLRQTPGLGGPSRAPGAGRQVVARAYWKRAPQSLASYIGAKIPSLKNLGLHPKGWTWRKYMNNRDWTLLEQVNSQQQDRNHGMSYGAMTKTP